MPPLLRSVPFLASFTPHVTFTHPRQIFFHAVAQSHSSIFRSRTEVVELYFCANVQSFPYLPGKKWDEWNGTRPHDRIKADEFSRYRMPRRATYFRHLEILVYRDGHNPHDHLERSYCCHALSFRDLFEIPSNAIYFPLDPLFFDVSGQPMVRGLTTEQIRDSLSLLYFLVNSPSC